MSDHLLDITHLHEHALVELCDPETPEAVCEAFAPSPYMNLPAFIKEAGDIVEKLHPPPDIRERLAKAVRRASEMLQELNLRPKP